MGTAKPPYFYGNEKKNGCLCMRIEELEEKYEFNI